MALKIKDYIISSLLLAHHYLRLIVDDHAVTVGLACQVELPIAAEGAPEPASWSVYHG